MRRGSRCVPPASGMIVLEFVVSEGIQPKETQTKAM